MGKHDEDFKQGCEDMDKANEALENNQIGKSLYYADKGIVNHITGLVKDPVGFLVELSIALTFFILDINYHNINKLHMSINTITVYNVFNKNVKYIR